VTETYPVRVAARKLNVRPQCILDFVKAGYLKMIKGQVTEESLDEVRWVLLFRLAESHSNSGKTVVT
jgi:hypothetical protein